MPAGHGRFRVLHQLAPPQIERGGHDVELQPALAQLPERLRDVLRFHVAEAQLHTAEPFRNLGNHVRRLVADARHVERPDRQDNVLRMQDVIVLDVMQQGRRRIIRVRRQEDGRAGDLCRRVRTGLLDGGGERLHRHVGAPRLGEQNGSAALPRPHDDGKAGSKENRNIAAIVDLEEVRAEEHHFQNDEG